ncbi:unnamed protein product [Closterium sp. Yama58-4]|nr:unnamed protein product [Closterium sp. Yama58-4]
MAIRARKAVTPWAVFASSAGVAALLVACLLSESGANFASAQSAQPAQSGDPDWVVQWLQNAGEPEPDAQPAPADLGWAAELVQGSDSLAQDPPAQDPPAQDPPAQDPPAQPAQGGPPADDPDSDDEDQEDDSSPPGFAGETDPQDSEGQAEPDWEAQIQSILKQVANQTFLNNFAQQLTFYCKFSTVLNRSEQPRTPSSPPSTAEPDWEAQTQLIL